MKKKQKRMIQWIAIGSGAVIILIVILVLAMSSDSRTVVEVEKVQRMDELVQIVTASGEIMPREYVDLQSEITGVITEIYVKEGDYVKKGDILLKIDPVQTEAETRAARMQVNSAEEDARNIQNQIAESKLQLLITEANLKSTLADLEQAKANLNRDELSFKRLQQLHEQNLISQQDYDQARATFKVSASRVDAAEAMVSQLQTQLDVSQLNIQRMESNYLSAQYRVKQLQANLDRAEDLLKKTVLYSPLTGVITKLEVERGERAVPGMMFNPTATLMTIADLSIIETEIKVDETDIINVKLRQPSVVKVDALPDQPLDGHVTEIGNSAINAGLTVGGSEEAKDFKVVIQLDNPPVILRPGLSATAEIITARKDSVLAIPLQALVMREVELDEAGDIVREWENGNGASAGRRKSDKDKEAEKVEKQGVFVVTKENRAVFTPVETGITGETHIEILEGLEKEDEIVIGSFRTLRALKDGEFILKKKAESTS
ncbi:MAG: efflux RND transporter periplasmic adaptor subunit [Acidobacteria bacterium]|nr:efflux RND transporter periplasmic adaptor subunit [Acidobacteriota bacterium]